MPDRKQRLVAGLLFFGACVLVFRAVSMFIGGAQDVFVGWVYALLALELGVDLVALIVLARWFALCTPPAQALALRVSALVVVIHAVRVGIFALGRLGPWVDFDVPPEERAAHSDRWTWGGVWFASILAFISVVILLWLRRRWSIRDGAKVREVPKSDERVRRDSVSMVEPYARIRVIVAVVLFVIALVVAGYRSLFG